HDGLVVGAGRAQQLVVCGLRGAAIVGRFVDGRLRCLGRHRPAEALMIGDARRMDLKRGAVLGHADQFFHAETPFCLGRGAGKSPAPAVSVVRDQPIRMAMCSGLMPATPQAIAISYLTWRYCRYNETSKVRPLTGSTIEMRSSAESPPSGRAGARAA